LGVWGETTGRRRSEEGQGRAAKMNECMSACAMEGNEVIREIKECD
jgi:hypothetical protein